MGLISANTPGDAATAESDNAMLLLSMGEKDRVTPAGLCWDEEPNVVVGVPGNCKRTLDGVRKVNLLGESNEGPALGPEPAPEPEPEGVSKGLVAAEALAGPMTAPPLTRPALPLLLLSAGEFGALVRATMAAMRFFHAAVAAALPGMVGGVVVGLSTDAPDAPAPTVNGGASLRTSAGSSCATRFINDPASRLLCDRLKLAARAAARTGEVIGWGGRALYGRLM